jgi:hypothetical protein
MCGLPQQRTHDIDQLVRTLEDQGQPLPVPRSDLDRQVTVSLENDPYADLPLGLFRRPREPSRTTD